MNIKKLNEEIKKVLNEEEYRADEIIENGEEVATIAEYPNTGDADIIYKYNDKYYVINIYGSEEIVVGPCDDENEAKEEYIKQVLSDISIDEFFEITDHVDRYILQYIDNNYSSEEDDVEEENDEDEVYNDSINDKDVNTNTKTFAQWFTQDLTGQTYNGDINCADKRLISLKGAPKEVSGDFVCSFNKLTSLQGAPQKVGGEFNCSHNNLTSLKNAPKEVGGDFVCSFNNLTSLKNAPQKVGGDFYCGYNKLTSLKGAPKPENIAGYLICDRNLEDKAIKLGYKVK